MGSTWDCPADAVGDGRGFSSPPSLGCLGPPCQGLLTAFLPVQPPSLQELVFESMGGVGGVTVEPGCGG